MGFWCRVLLLTYPREFRDTYGGDFLRFVTRQRIEARYNRRLLGALRFWWDVTADSIVSGGRMRARGVLAPAASCRSMVSKTGSRHEKKKVMNMLLGGLLRDIRYGVRSLRRSPAFSLTVVVTLAFGIGANTAMFTVIDSVIRRPLPYPDSHELVMVWGVYGDENRSSTSWPDFRDWRDETESFSEIAGYAEATVVFERDDGADELLGSSVTANIFALLKVPPALGRPFTEDEDRFGGPRAVILSHDTWQGRFGGDSSIVGRSTVLDGEAHTVVGVMPAGFRFPDPSVRFWKPMREDELLRRMGITSSGRGLSFMDVIGRLAPNTSLRQATIEMEALTRSVDEAVGRRSPREISLERRQDFLVGDVSSMLFIFLGAVGLVLAIACANVANLSLARAVARGRELALRTALGAGRGRLIRQLLTESVLLAAVGGALGCLMAFVFTRLLIAVGADSIPRGADIAMNGSVLAYTAAVALLCGMVTGLLPAFKAGGSQLVVSLKDGGRGVSGGGRGQRTQQSLVVVQVALAVTLLMGAGLLMNSLVRLLSVETGFDANNVLSARVSLPDSRYQDDPAVLNFFDRLVPSIEALPGVRSVSTSYSPPFAQSDFRQSFQVEGTEEVSPDEQPWGGTVIVRPGYFETIGATLLRGRDFTDADRKSAPPVAIVNETMAGRFWPNGDPVGKRFRTRDGISGSVESLEERHLEAGWITVVGVAADVRRSSLADESVAEFYRPHAQMIWPGMGIVVRTSGNPLDLAAALRREVWAIDPSLPVTRLSTMKQMISASVVEPRFRTLLLGIFAAVASVLAMVGVYGVMAYAVTQRTQEIGIRLALGAEHSVVRRKVLWDGLRLAGAGVALGLVGAVAGTRLITDMLFGITPTDPITYVAVVASVLGVAALASYVPARRASRVDPLTALRSD